MHPYELILKKRNGNKHAAEEINFLIQNFTANLLPDYQMAAWAMAVYFRGLDFEETFYLTKALQNSGTTLDLSFLPGVKVDKHSTGGVGDKTTLILVPLLASLGLPMLKMAGRGLGHTGGTIDKLSSIPGFKTDLSLEEIFSQMQKIGLAIVSQTSDLAPADKKLYQLRDATATADVPSFIASSIMSKKLASGADALVLDVKVGRGAFCPTKEDALSLAQMMVKIGEKSGLKTVALLSEMNQPLGMAVGNALEVKEAISILQGGGPDDLKELSLELGSLLLFLAGKVKKPSLAKEILEEKLKDGSALNKFGEMIAWQGGERRFIDDPHRFLPRAEHIFEIKANKSGWVGLADALGIGLASMFLGAGRKKAEDTIDPAAGVILKVKRGDRIKRGDILAEAHTNQEEKEATDGLSSLEASFVIEKEKPDDLPLVYDIIGDID